METRLIFLHIEIPIHSLPQDGQCSSSLAHASDQCAELVASKLNPKGGEQLETYSHGPNKLLKECFGDETLVTFSIC